MAKTKISEFDANPANNTDIDGINLAEGMAPGLVNNAIRELMAQLKDFQAGSVGDNFSVGGNLAVTGTSAFTGASAFTGNVTMSGTLTVGSNAVDAFPSGTKMLFQQTTAPTGWTKDTTNNDKALRVVSGTAGTGGSVAFTTAFANQNVGNTALTEAQLPAHTHSFSGTGSTDSAGAHTHASSYTDRYTSAATAVNTGIVGTVGIPSSGNSSSVRTGGGDGGTTGLYFTGATATKSLTTDSAGAHTHTVSVSGTVGSTGSGAVHTHSLNIAVSYVDVIIATKN